jgi:hypothetical protein
MKPETFEEAVQRIDRQFKEASEKGRELALSICARLKDEAITPEQARKENREVDKWMRAQRAAVKELRELRRARPDEPLPKAKKGGARP